MVENEERVFKGHCIDHGICLVKIGQLCTWQTSHDVHHEKENDAMVVYKESVAAKMATNKNLLIGGLVALVLNLVGVISTLGFLMLHSV